MKKVFQFGGYLFERTYPYIIAVMFFFIIERHSINYIHSENIQAALDAVINMTALILGLGGALIPIVIGLKGESEFVRRILNDEDKLFFKYLKEMIIGGLLLLIITMCLYFVDDIDNEFVTHHAFPSWVSMLIIFMLQTYRSIIVMLKLIFDNHIIRRNPEDIIPDESSNMDEFRERHRE